LSTYLHDSGTVLTWALVPVSEEKAGVLPNTDGVSLEERGGRGRCEARTVSVITGHLRMVCIVETVRRSGDT